MRGYVNLQKSHFILSQVILAVNDDITPLHVVMLPIDKGTCTRARALGGVIIATTHIVMLLVVMLLVALLLLLVVVVVVVIVVVDATTIFFFFLKGSTVVRVVEQGSGIRSACRGRGVGVE